MRKTLRSGLLRASREISKSRSFVETSTMPCRTRTCAFHESLWLNNASSWTLSAELVRLKVDVLVPAGTPASIAAQKATTTIPIVMASVGDPVRSGLAKSLARPGGNITGLSNMVYDLGPKRLEMLYAMVPRLERMAVLINPSNATNPA